jgi:hypothetical protein
MGMPYAAEEIADEPAMAPAPAVRRLAVGDLDVPALEQPPAPPEMVTRAQQKAMFKLWADLGYGTEADRETRLGLTARFIGAESIESSDDLTGAEAEVVLAKLRERKERTAAGDTDA